MKGERVKAFIGITAIIILFILASVLVNSNIEITKSYLSDSYLSMGIYFVLIVSEIILAPVSLIPLIPLASAIWGSLISFLLTITGWTLGSVIAFVLARKLGSPLLTKIVSVKELNKYQKFIPQKNLFLGVILTRLLIPIDIMSYAIALFTKIDTKKFALATLLGFIPGVFILSYFGEIPTEIKYIIAAVGVISIIAISIFNKRIKSFLERLFK
ncbi:MAG: TVP38/TMEM64 family protein [Nanoarchaeota archaeon]|nr:TVP38/TMEM64 family protein [Nanoarchaeota archaeon]